MLCTFTFPNGDVWNAMVPKVDGGIAVLENFRVVSLSDGTVRRTVGPFTPRNPLEVGTPVTLVESKTHGAVVMTDVVSSLVETGTDGVCVSVPNTSLVYRMGTTIDQDLPPHHTVNDYLVPMEEEVATQEPVEDTEENNTDDVVKGEQTMGVMDVSIPISDRSYSTWKDKHLQQFTVFSHDDFLGVGLGEAVHYNTMDIMIDDTTILYGDMDDTHRTRIVDTNNVFSNLHWNLREMKPGITIPYAIHCRETQSTTVSGVGTHYVVDGDWPTILEKCDINDRYRQIMHKYKVSEPVEDTEDTEENNTDDVMKGEQSMGVMDVSIPISDRSYSTWKNKRLTEFARYDDRGYVEFLREPRHESKFDVPMHVYIHDKAILYGDNNNDVIARIFDRSDVFSNLSITPPLRELKPGVCIPYRNHINARETVTSGVATHYVVDDPMYPTILKVCDMGVGTLTYMREKMDTLEPRDGDVEYAEGPRKQSVAKARPQSMVKPPVPVTKAHADLRELGFTMHGAARNGDCFPLSAMAGFEIPDLADVAAPTVRTLETVKTARIAAVDLVTGSAPIGGIDAAVVRENEDLPDTSILNAWKTLGHWRPRTEQAGASTAFMFAMAHNLKRPVIVMEREGDVILAPCYIYAKRDGNGTLFTSPPRGGVPKTVPFVKQMAFADVLTALKERPTGYSLVEYDRDASHHSPVVYTPVPPPPFEDGDVTEEEEDDVEDEEEATYTVEEHPPPRLHNVYNVVRIKPPAAPVAPRTTFRPCDIMVGCSKPYMHTGICDVITCGARKRAQTDHYVTPDDVERDDVEDDGDDDYVPERTSSHPVARSAPQPPIMVHENSFPESFMQREVDTYDLGYYNSDGQRAYKYVNPKPHGGYYVQATVQGQTRYIGKFDRSLVAVYAIIATRRNPTRLGGDSGAVRRWIEKMVTYFADTSTSRATKRPRVEELE